MAGRKQQTRTRARARSPVEMPVDVSGQQGTIEVVIGLMDQLSRQRKHFKAVAAMNGHSLDDPAAGYPPTREDGTVNSYKRLLADLDEQQERLRALHPEEVAEVERRARERDKARQNGAGA